MENTISRTIADNVLGNKRSDSLTNEQASMDRNFGLQEQDFKKLVRDIQAGDNSSFEDIFLIHFTDCVAYLKRTYTAPHQDAYDASMETMLRFHHRIKTGKIVYGNLRFLFTQMAVHHYLKWIKREQRNTNFSEAVIGHISPSIDDDALEVLDLAWQQLGTNCKALLKSFYYEGKSMEAIAEGLGRSTVAVRKQKQRCVEKLRDIFMQLSKNRY